VPEACLLAATLWISGWGALRVAARWSAGALARACVTATLLGALAALVPLLCGLTGLGTRPVALAGLSVILAAAAGLAAGPPREALAPQATRALAAATRAQRTLAGAVAGALAGLLAALLHSPGVRTDGYHLTEVVRWLHEGRPGTSELVVHEWPAGDYPLTNELVLTWATGIARSFAPTSLLTVAFTVLLGLAIATLLRNRGAPFGIVALGTAALLLAAATTGTLESVGTDLPSLAWLACCAALLSPRDRSERDLGPALLAAGLAAGTKSTTALFAAALLLAACRPWRLRVPRPPAAAAALAAAALCLPWPVRNLLEHGSPLWPFSSPGFGDPVPFVLDRLQTSFLDRPLASLEMYLRYSTGDVATTGLLLAGALLAAGLSRRPDVRFAAALGLLGALVWAASPITGPPEPPAVESMTQASLRYALPATLTAGIAIAIAAAGTGRGALLARAVLALCCLGCLYLLPFRVFPSGAHAWAALAAAVAGGVAGRTWGVRAPPPAAAALALATLVILACPWTGPRYLSPTVGYGLTYRGVFRWLDEQPRFREGRAPVFADWLPDGRLSGARLEHDVILLATAAPCAEIREAADTGWLVVLRSEHVAPYMRPAPGERCLTDRAPAYRDAFRAVYTRLAG
jgi:hypothetical protein